MKGSSNVAIEVTINFPDLYQIVLMLPPVALFSVKESKVYVDLANFIDSSVRCKQRRVLSE
jgi:hypothetical protein